MRNILRIFRNDLKAIYKYFFVILIVIALGTLPSLYAWINIYANWDPYAGTKDIEVALASRDTGIDLKNETHVNSADEVIADVKDDDKIGYRPLDDPEEAIEGVRSGRYYAAIIFEDGFSYDMHHFEEAVGDRQPRITYYTNIKKNPVASKITDQAADDLLEKINSEYLRTALTKYFGDAEKAGDEVDLDEMTDNALEQLTATRDALHDYSASISQIMATKGDASKALKNAQKKLDNSRSEGRSDLAKAKQKIETAKAAIKDVSKTIDSKSQKLNTAIADLKSTLEQLQGPIDESMKAELQETGLERADRVLTILQDLRGLLPEDPKTTAGRASADALDVMIGQAEHIKTLLQKDPASAEILSDAETLEGLLKDDLAPSLKLMMSDISKALDRTKPLLKSAGGILDDVDPVIGSAGDTVDSLDASLDGLQITLNSLETKLDDMIEQVQEAEGSDKIDVLSNLLGVSAEQYSDLFTDFVEIESEEYFETVSYGAAMTPFYSIIALWVGGVMLVTIMNCTADRKKYPQINEAEGFFGRYLIFFLIGQIQAAVVVAGDIFLLHCSPVHPWLMWLSAAITSMVFVIIIYALTLVFGDIGRAAVVVIMVIQIAGSSGTYPIEILPEIFGKIYTFFPFPYAINAMREAICGLYGHDFVKYLAQLMVFFLCAVLLGICVRKPFLGVKQFMQAKMKETEVM
ncbi:MAG: YhgE/Pip domain-containing protein [Firmicutes bacterium]|nr:YhgE/Pip domain-containing protein [Bacillota bacterium]